MMSYEGRIFLATILGSKDARLVLLFLQVQCMQGINGQTVMASRKRKKKSTK